MDNRNLWRLRLVGVAVGVLAALLIWPASRWLVSAQLASLVPGRASASNWAVALAGLPGPVFEAETRAVHRTAASMPGDYSLQLADAVTAPPINTLSSTVTPARSANITLASTVKVARLRDLASRFPDRPSIYANILRFAMLSDIRVRREEENRMIEHPGALTPYTIDPIQLAAFDRDAAEGERLDPDNAYFPFLRAAGLFAGHRDAEALAAVHRAAQKPLWMEYYEDEVDGQWRLMDRTFGETGALPRISTWSAILLPHYAQVRAVGRMAVVSAMQAEQAGRMEQGIAIREDLMRCGGLMRTDARSLIGSLVGSSLAMMALQRPQGIPLISVPEKDGSKAAHAAVRERLVAQYDVFLRRAGHLEQSARAHGEAAAAAQLRDIVSHNTLTGAFGPRLWQLGLGWWAGLQLLGSALLTLVIGGAATLAYRNRRLRAGHPFPAWAGRGVMLGTFAALLSGVAVFPAAAPPAALWLASVTVFGLLALALPAPDRAYRLRTFGAYAASLVVAGGCILLLAWYFPSTAEPVRKIALYLFRINAQPENHIDPGFELIFLGSSTADLIYHLITLLASTIVPLLAALTFAMVSRVTRVPLSVAMVRGFRGCAVPIASGLVLAYAALLPITLRLESSAEDAVRPSLRHEGRYLAALEGKDWPGRIP